MKDIVVMTTVYKGVEPFLNDFLDSISLQTEKELSLLILNDGMVNVEGFISRYDLDYCILNFEGNLTPADIRAGGINFCVSNNVIYLVFADADDIHKPERVRKSIESLKHSDIVINNLEIMDLAAAVVSDNYFEGIKDDQLCFEGIIEKNYYGLSNTAVKCEILKTIPSIPSDIIAVDWWIFTLLEYQEFTVEYISESLTRYRQHESNIAGVTKKATKETVMRGLAVKVVHYKNLRNYFAMIRNGNMSGFFENLYLEFENLYMRVTQDDEFMKVYLNHIWTTSCANNAWWADIILYPERS